MSTSHGSTWSDAEVSTLIPVWEEADIQDQLDGATRNQTILLAYQKGSSCIPKRLKENGYERLATMPCQNIVSQGRV